MRARGCTCSDLQLDRVGCDCPIGRATFDEGGDDPVALILDAIDDDRDPGQRGPCPGHIWAYTGSAYGGDDESYHGEGRAYCEICGADGDA